MDWAGGLGTAIQAIISDVHGNLEALQAVLKAVRRERRGVRKLFFYDWVATGWWQNLTRFYWQRFTNARRKPTDEAYFKTLGRLAVEAGNLRAEKQFLAGQVRARRHMSDKITGLPTGTLNYLIGIISELTSNFGRSLLRPLYSWVLVFAVFTGIYLHEAENSIIEPCQNNESITPLKAAGELSLANALRVSWPFEAHMNDMHRCLYGEAIPVKKETKDQARLDAIEEVKDIAPPPPQPKIPHAVAMWGLLQTVLSFILMGVFVINLRNRFKM